MSIVVKAGIRLLFEINLEDLRTDPLNKEGMMENRPASYNHIIRRMKT